ncbi:MAG: arylsulfatase, partial [Planctomycetota bacterium]|nr:arylsulfatase [Planctomycetota bacterium]
AGHVSSQLANTTDILATLASVAGHELPDAAAVDSFDLLPAMLGTRQDSEPIRPWMLTQSFRGEFQLRQGPWKYLDHKGSGGNNYDRGMLKDYALPETAPDATGQLFHLEQDPGETTNLFFSAAPRREQMQTLLQKLIGTTGRTAPTGRKPIGVRNIPVVTSH